ncbi:MAG: UDP-2,3-diacylglucosamine diphosphatase [Muribaculaceae bacterium]|nr:UDP-2,3-diacylglucosamine diphosphatase [Muribaculaceae bacterium]
MVIFLSDTHLGSPHSDAGHAAERRVTAFLRSLPAEVKHIYLLGDILDYWFEYRTVAPRGFVRFFGELARLTDSGVRVTWITGNHDIWLFDYLEGELGVEIVDEPYIIREIYGKRFLLGHGDRIGRRPASFRLLSRFFRNRICQKLFAAVHPGLTVRLAHKWSSSSRTSDTGPTSQDIARITADAAALSAEHPKVDYIVEGHHHITLDTKAGNARLMVLGDWNGSGWYASFDGAELRLREVNHD